MGYLLVFLALGLCLSSCRHVADQVVLGSMEAAAKDQIMLVRKDPASFGYRRLETHLTTFPELKIFISQHDIPDFLAETGTQNRRYFILYYLKNRQAFISRVSADNQASLEFSGPYPITSKEFKLLDGFRSDPSRRTVKF